MAAQRDEALSSLITAGTWLRALQVGSRAAALSGEEQCAELLRQPALVSFLRSELQRLPEKARTGPVVSEADAVLADIGAQMDAPAGAAFTTERAAGINARAAGFISGMSAKKQP